MKRIPKSFQLGGHTIKVEYVADEDEMLKHTNGHPAYGVFLPDTRPIWHEFSHALLWVLGHKDWTNEKVVDPMGHLLKQFNDTATF